jgi:hypothetical protein
MESGRMMLLHSLLIGIVLYLLMVWMGQRPAVAENRSLLLAAIVLIYMILFGHGMPGSINQNL